MTHSRLGFTVRRFMAVIAVVAVVLALSQFWMTEEARQNRAYCFRASDEFWQYAATLRRDARQSKSAAERTKLEKDARDCEATSREYWWLALQPWADVPSNPFDSE